MVKTMMNGSIPYQLQMGYLLECLGRDHPRYAEALSLQASLLESLTLTRRIDYGSTAEALSKYNWTAIRNLLREAFTAKELQRFCHDRPAFAPVISEFGVNASLEDMIDAIIGYCQTRMLVEDLLLQIREERPRHYERHLPYHADGVAPTHLPAEHPEVEGTPNRDGVGARAASRQTADLAALDQLARDTLGISFFALGKDTAARARSKSRPARLFPFLSSFESDDAEIFFGREQETEQLLAHIEQDPVVVVNGLSGCGKSSLIKAAILPRLRELGYLPIYT